MSSAQPLYTLYDSDNPLAIPLGVKAAGYDDGYAASAWAAYGWARFPDALHITVFGLPDSDVFDIESQDGTPQQSGPWAVQRRARRKIAIPYCERSNGHAVEDSLHASGIAIDEAMLWIATDDGTREVTHWSDGSPVTYPVWAVQYLNEAHGSGGHYDLSLVYLALGPAQPKERETMPPILFLRSNGEVWLLTDRLYVHIPKPSDVAAWIVGGAKDATKDSSGNNAFISEEMHALLSAGYRLPATVSA